MQVPRRFSVGWLMGVVAAVALVFGLAIELRTHRERDLAAASETEARAFATWHREQIRVCDRAIAADQTYSVKQRNFLLRRSARDNHLAPDFELFDNWVSERNHHNYRAGIFEAEAASFAAKRQAAQARLLLPF